MLHFLYIYKKEKADLLDGFGKDFNRQRRYFYLHTIDAVMEELEDIYSEYQLQQLSKKEAPVAGISESEEYTGSQK